MKKGGLGKGLDSLISKELKDNVSRETLLRIAEVEPNRDQPRKNIDHKAIVELSESIKEHGVIQPIIVVKCDGYYKIVAGERRWRAAKEAGLTKIPALIKDYTEKEISEVALIENLQRENLNPIDEANGYDRLKKEYELTQEEIAKVVSKSRAYVTNMMRLLKLDKEVQEYLRDGRISVGHAKVLVPLDKEKQADIAKQVINKELSVRDVERLINTKQFNKKETDASIKNIEKELEDSIHAKVTIKNSSKNKGTISIRYQSLDDFDRIITKLKR